MPGNNLLNTNTVNLGDLLGNGRIYHVPPFQRDYSWQEEQWEDLWQDIVELIKEPDGRHYMGALVLEDQGERRYSIIDGQQRLATLSILSLAIIGRIAQLSETGVEPEKNSQRVQELKAGFIGQRDPASLIESAKLNLNEGDDPFYQDYLIRFRSPKNPRSLSKSNQQLWKCFNYYSERVAALDEDSNDGLSLALLLSKTIATKLLFISITVDDELNAYTVFETLNARGLELSATDLLKNFLFSRVKVGADLESLRRRWARIIGTVRQERFPELLRFHFLCDTPRIRSERLFKHARGRIRDASDVFNLLDDLESRADLFSALRDPSHEFWIEEPGCKAHIVELNLFRATQMTPLLFAAYERFSSENFRRALRLVSAITFRYTVVSGLNPNELELVYHRAAKAVLKGEATSIPEVFEILKSIYVDNDKFKHDFSRLAISSRGPRKKLIKYILCKLEEDESGIAINPETEPGTIEHILPENPAATWDNSISIEHWDNVTYRIGNMTLLEVTKNRTIGNQAYSEKALSYADSRYEITRMIPEHAPEEWTVSYIDDRQQKMAKRAAHIWRSDFDADS